MSDLGHFTIFTAEGGSERDRKEAEKVFEIGKSYKVLHGRMGGCYTSIKLEGVAGYWNSCLFDIDIHSCSVIEKTYI